MSDQANWSGLWLFLTILSIAIAWSAVEIIDRLDRIERALEQPVPAG
jgi:hypothetical protein